MNNRDGNAMKKSRGILGLTLCAALALAPALAEAKAGGGFSGGSRGSRSYSAPQSTPTAPQSKPLERSTTTQQRQQQAAPPATAPGAQPSFAQRNPFMTGLMGGLIGAGIGSLLFGGGFFPAGGAGMLGLLLQLALIGALAYLALRIWRSRQGQPQKSPYAYAGFDPRDQQQRSPVDVKPLDVATGRVGEAPAYTAAQDDVGIQPADFDEFERLLAEVQKAWSAGDVGALRRHVTPEMLSYFSEQLSENASSGIENHVEAVKLEQGDLAESWREGHVDYATVAMRWSALDYTIRADGGAVVDGSKTARVDETEVWTFMRTSGGRWLLSAIQQVEAVA
jgi:predicted lipid-binding transport protein (Tim44 family)